MRPYCAGIDLGTTNTVLSVWREGAPAPEVVPILQPYSDFGPEGLREDELLDSVLTLHQGRAYVGALARQLGLARGASTFSSIKRYMGRHWFRYQDGRGWTPERVSACILRVTYEELGRRFGAPPARLVVTIPASFGMEARRATLRAAVLAGFEAKRLSLFDEPTAALLAELQAERPGVDTSGGGLHAIVDIGGGTLDVSLVRAVRNPERTTFDVIGQSRYNELAGDDFDLNIAGLLLHRFEETNGPISAMADSERRLLCWALVREARSVKVRLSDALADTPPGKWHERRESVAITEFPDFPPWRYELSGQDLRDALAEYFPFKETAEERRSEFGFFKPIQECLDTASVVEGYPVSPQDIDHVWLTGGSSKLPPVRVAVQKLLEQRPRIVRQPMYAVAIGAAWKAGLDAGFARGGFEVKERMFDGIYLKRADGTFHALVPVRQEVPMARREHVGLLQMPVADPRLVLELFLGDASDGEGAPTFTPLAQRRVTFPTVLPAGQPLALAATLTRDRELLLDLSTTLGGRRLDGRIEVSTAAGWEEVDSPVPLPPVNPTEAP